MIKSLEELKKIRQESFGKVALRKHGQTTGETIEVRVGSSSDNLSSGRETLNAFIDDVAKEGLNNVKVILVNNSGDPQLEPMVGVIMPGLESVVYENVNVDRAHQIFAKHIKGGQQL